MRYFKVSGTLRRGLVCVLSQPPKPWFDKDFPKKRGKPAKSLRERLSNLLQSGLEQRKRFKQRLDDPNRHWKISEADYAERPYWDSYQQAYEDALNHCSTESAPWFVIPADHKWFRNLTISRIVVEYLEGLDMQFPEPHVDIEEISNKYHAEERNQGR